MSLEHPVTWAVDDYRRRTEPGERLDALLLAFETLIRVDALLLAGAFVASPRVGDDMVRALLLAPKLSLGDWNSLLHAQLAVLPSEEFPALRTWFAGTKKAVKGGAIPALIEIRNRRAHAPERTNTAVVAGWLDQAEALFAACLDAHPGGGQFEAGGEELVWSIDGVDRRAGPFLLPGHLAGETERVLLYHHAGKGQLVYGSRSGARYQSAPLYDLVCDRLRKQIAPQEEVPAATCPPDLFARRLADASRHAVGRLQELRRYRPETTVDRPEADSRLAAFIRGPRRLLVVHGPAGAGKTTWLCGLVRRRIDLDGVVLFETADRLDAGRLPDSFAGPLRVRGELATALDRLGTSSSDGAVLVIADDIDSGDEFDTFMASLNWAERLAPTSPVRIVVSLPTDRFRRFAELHADAVASPALDVLELTPLDYHELLALGRLLPFPDDADRGLLLALRGEAARRLCQAPGASVRRPALAAVLLGAVQPGTAGGFSAAAAYREIYRHAVLGVLHDGRPRFPHRGRAVRTVAELNCRRGRLELRLDDPELNLAGLIDRATGERSADFRGLLEADVLVERCEEFDTLVSFADQRLLEFAAAVALADRPLEDSLAALAPRAEAFPPAGGAAAHLIILATRSGGTPPVAAAAAARPPGELVRLAVGTAIVDADTFRQLVPDLARLAPEGIEEVVRQLLAAGEPRLAADAADALVHSASPERIRADEVAYLHAFALYDVDDYEGAARRLPSGDRSPRALTLRADIAVGRGDFDRAREAYEELIRDGTAGPLARGNAFRGLGYVLGRMGRLAEADTVLAQAVGVLRQCGDTLELAEALGDHGDVLTRLDRLMEARCLLEEDVAVCRRLGRPACEGIATALLAEVDWRDGDRASAEQRLRAALDVVRGVSYRWREAWLLRRLADLCDEQGREAEARGLRGEADQAFADLGSTKQ